MCYLLVSSYVISFFVQQNIPYQDRDFCITLLEYVELSSYQIEVSIFYPSLRKPNFYFLLYANIYWKSSNWIFQCVFFYPNAIAFPRFYDRVYGILHLIQPIGDS